MFAVLLLGSLPAGAQTVSSTIRGKVTDLDGNGLPGVKVVAVEIVRTIVGTLGIIAAVPLTTWFATIWPDAKPHIH